ncbi:MAG TPA: DUF2516 family protein [Acidimicrobiales bacterium]|nr:DUF2516 family protein [Acidimicrobiales bacterium]
MTVLGAVVAIVVVSIPLALSVWALLDAARRPEWAFALAGRSRVVWVAACGIGVLFNLVGLCVAAWYLVRVRPGVAAAETGQISRGDLG